MYIVRLSNGDMLNLAQIVRTQENGPAYNKLIVYFAQQYSAMSDEYLVLDDDDADLVRHHLSRLCQS